MGSFLHLARAIEADASASANTAPLVVAQQTTVAIEPGPVIEADSTPSEQQSTLVPTNSSARVAEAATETPYRLTKENVSSDLKQLSEDLNTLNSVGIEVLAHKGRIPKRCSSGSNQTTSTSGLAIKTHAHYPACPDGSQPIYDAYKPAGFNCVVVYNANSPNKLAILAHELAHCRHFQFGQYRKFDIDYKQLRDVSHLSSHQRNEIIADDLMMCVYSRDTNWGSASYYSRYSVDKPNDTKCEQIVELASQYLY
ncbi:MAG: hypothetical protein AAF413_03175 [Patescibacteria group bacterium]